MERKYFKYNHWTYSGLLHPSSMGLWACREGMCHYLGRYEGGEVFPANIEKLPEWHLRKGAERLYSLILSHPPNIELERRSGMIYNRKMARKRKKERNRLIVELHEGKIDKKRWSFSEIAEEIGLKSKSTVHEIYWNEKRRMKLSTR